MSPQVLVAGVAGVLFLGSLLRLLLSLLTSGTASLPASLIGLVITGLLAFSLLEGKALGRWFTVVLMGLGGIAMVIAGFALFSTQGVGGLILVIPGLINVACAAALLTPTASDHFE